MELNDNMVLFCILLLFWKFYGCYSVSFQPPLLSVGSNMDVEVNSTLNITCWGVHPVNWRVPSSLQEYFDAYTIESSTSDASDDYKYLSIVTVGYTVASDTGFYSCYFNDTTDFSYTGNVTSVYIFVNDPDLVLFPIPPSPLVAHQQSYLEIPCRPLYSHATVTLWNVTYPENTQLPLGKNLRFDPTKGFIIDFVTPQHKGFFTCKASVGNYSKELDIVLHNMPKTSFAPKPRINYTQAEDAIVGDTFNIVCYVLVEHTTYVYFDWSYPNMNNPRVEVHKSETETIDSNDLKLLSSKLTISNAQKNDTGKYKCDVGDHSNKSDSTEQYIQIYDSKPQSYINFSSNLSSSEFVREAGNELIIAVYYKSFPSTVAVRFSWTVNNASLKNCSYSSISNSTQVTLIIEKLQRCHAGQWILSGVMPDSISQASFDVYIIDKPAVNIKASSNYYFVGRRYTLSCIADSYLLPQNVTLLWKPCSDPSTCPLDASESWISIKNSENDITMSQIKNASMIIVNFNVTAYQSGYFRCEAVNEKGSDDYTSSFFVTDAENGFEVKSSIEEPVETDNLTIICRANNYEFADLMWMWQPVGNADFITLDTYNKSNSSESTKYSHALMHYIYDIQTNDSGKYQCRATHIRNSSTYAVKVVEINIKALREPFIVSTNMNGTLFTASIETQFEMFCYVDGTPTPQVTWKKNGEIFDAVNISGVDFENRSQHLIFKRVVFSDAGEYECHAENRVGKVLQTAVLSLPLVLESVKEEEKTTTNAFIGIFVVAALALIILVIALGRKIYKEQKLKREMSIFNHALFERGQVEMLSPEMSLDDKAELLPYDHRWEFPKDCLKLGRIIGQGAFGRVLKAEAIGLDGDGTSTTVAVKMLKQSADSNQRRALMAELKILIHLGRHLNIVNLLGAVTKNISRGELLVIVEYCRYGNLREHLLRDRANFVNQIDPSTNEIDPSISNIPRWSEGSSKSDHVDYVNTSPLAVENPTYRDKIISYIQMVQEKNNSIIDAKSPLNSTTTACSSCDTDVSFVGSGRYRVSSSCKDDWKKESVTTCDLLCYAFQCARGMEYLASRKLIHRDLAARNVLLAEGKIVKICDFGLAKDCYKYNNYVKKGDGPLPIKWMAIESIRDKVFTSESDVWSFGVLLWEMFTLGGNPYPGIDIDEEFYRRLKYGHRMDKPEFAPDHVYAIMLDCWRADPKFRPSFSTLVELFGHTLEGGMRQHYIDLNDPYMEMNKEFLNSDYLIMDNPESNSYINVSEATEDYCHNSISAEQSVPNQYDNVPSIRPVGSGPVPKEPMEVVPMIQLDSFSDKEDEPPTSDRTLTPQVNAPLKCSSFSPKHSSKPAFKNDYICMNNIDCNDEECQSLHDDNDSVFLSNSPDPEKFIRSPLSLL